MELPARSARLVVVVVVTVVVVAQRAAAQPLQSVDPNTVAQAASYLTKYGYSAPQSSSGKSSALRSLSTEIARFQRFAGLNVTGELDQATIDKMRQPRCGVKDIVGPGYRARRRKRYALQGSRWRTRDIKYRIDSWPSSVQDRESVRRVIRQAFQIWADVSSLTFREAGPFEKAHIDIKFTRGDHGDGDPFDGRGGTLAHAFFPLYGGDAHFDDAERWSAGGLFGYGTDIFMTAAHEFGHSLGLSHSDDQQALMAPFYKPPSRSRNVLKEDDRLGIQALYGPPPTSPPIRGSGLPDKSYPAPQSPVGPALGEDRILCSDASVDAMITAGSQKQTYVFKGDKYWRLTDTGLEKGYPRRIRDYWDGVPEHMDAAFSWPAHNRIYFFKGNQYWRMTNFKMDRGYPKYISLGFRGIPSNVDAVFQWTANGKLYFFKGNQYWKFDPSRNQPVSSSYPQPISNWGLPANLDAALTYSNGRSYFFKKGYYYRFNDAAFKVDEADPPYPRPAGYWWFGCKSQSSNLMSEGAGRRRAFARGVPNSDAVMMFGDENVPSLRSRSAASRPAEVSRLRLVPLLLLPLVLLRRAV